MRVSLQGSAGMARLADQEGGEAATLLGSVTPRHLDDLLDGPAVAVDMQFQMACGVDKTRHGRWMDSTPICGSSSMCTARVARCGRQAAGPALASTSASSAHAEAVSTGG